ncbi:AAA family ATPase [Sphingomonas endophytica]|uniref:ATP-binding protein n=1 Tax=Sphingomonas endophytica TaxID=869719 RepID=A0A147I1R7_9SPHN|nr:AAA family ATPase [Sphingomonas endophytica]KTT71541.1 ATP-binding protein [Sphingomonas endophytica]
MARGFQTKLPPPYLKQVRLRDDVPIDRTRYPYNLPLLRDDDFVLHFDRSITIMVGENGVGKSTLLEGIAAIAGFDEAGGGPGYRPLDHSTAIEWNGDRLQDILRASWLPKVGQGWFFRAESFFSVSRYLDQAALEVSALPPDFLSHSHGEGFLRFFAERCARPGIFLFDEPESALSPRRQFEFVNLLRTIAAEGKAQVIVATHSPILMATPEARLLSVTRAGIDPIALEDTDHYRLYREFVLDPHGVVEAMSDD